MRLYKDMGDWCLTIGRFQILFFPDYRDWFPITSWQLRPTLWIDLGVILIGDSHTWWLE